MNKSLFCYFAFIVVLINVGYLKGQNEMICKKCSNNTVQYLERCVVPIPDGQLCSPTTSLCQNYELSCIRKNVSANYTCDKCNDNQFPSFYERTCKDKIKDGEICLNPMDTCLNPEFSCLELIKNDSTLRCGKCSENEFLDYITNTCVKKIRDDQNQTKIENGRLCPNENGFCKTPEYRCLRKNKNDRKFYCLKCGRNQITDFLEFRCKDKVKIGKACSKPWDLCEDTLFSCLKKKPTDTKLFCLKCKKNQYINSELNCKNKIGNGKPCKNFMDKCQTKGFECLEK